MDERFPHLQTQEQLDRAENNKSMKMWAWYFLLSVPLGLTVYVLIIISLVKYIFS